MVGSDPTTVFRADAGLHIGSGHVMRCLSLAAALRELGGRSHFVCRAHDGHLGALIEAQGHALHLLPHSTDWGSDAEQTLQAIDGMQPDWLVVDHYGLDARWEQRVGAVAGQCLAIDDLADRPHTAALLLDQNLQSRPGRYVGRLEATARTLIGPRYALLRSEFTARRGQRSNRDGRLRQVLATAGGVDQTDLLSKVVAAWATLPSAQRPELALVVGSSSPNLESLRAMSERHAGCTLHMQTDRMADLIDAADLMVTAAGSVNWERCCLGVPALLCATAPNQADNLVQLARSRTAIALGEAASLKVDMLRSMLVRLTERPLLLRRMSRRAAALVDGHGARRVAVAMLAGRLSLCPAKAADAELAWHWRNHESTRRWSIGTEPIPLEAHLGWWQASLVNPERSLLIARIGEIPVGVLRLDHQGPDSTVSIYLDPQLTGLGLGPRLLREGRGWLRSHRPGTRWLLAVIRADNLASAQAFTAAGFRHRASDDLWVCEADSSPEHALHRDPNHVQD